jgi:hypothetical protein
MKKALQLSPLLLILFSLTLVSCGGGTKTEKVDFSYSLGGIVTGTPMDGGIYLWADRIDPDTGAITETLMLDLIDDSAEIPFGNWEFHLVGYQGPGEWSGNNYCGSVPETFLDSDEISLQVTFTDANCANSPFPEMITQKAANLAGGLALWDSATWDSSTFGP